MKIKFLFTRKVLGIVILIAGVTLIGNLRAKASDLTSTNFIIKDPIIGTAGGYGTSSSFKLISSGNTILSGVGSSASYQTHYGFLYYQDEVPTITFDIDTASDFSNGESSAPYAVQLGTLSSASVKSSDTSSIRMITLEADSSDGVVVTVHNANGADGLVSASVPSDKIPSITSTMSTGTANYGLCVATSGLTGFSRSTGYSSDTCALSSGTNGVQALSTTATSIVHSGGSPLTGGHAEIVVNGAANTATPAHSDYGDTLTFIATGTF